MHTRISRILVVTVAMLAAGLFLFQTHRADGADDSCRRARTFTAGETSTEQNGNNSQASKTPQPMYQPADPPLVVAARYGQLGAIRKLVAEGADLNALGTKGRTALMAAAEYDHVPAVRLLLEMGADPNASGRSGRTALMVASREGRVEVAKILLAGGASVNARTRFAPTALMEAARGGYAEVARVLLDRGANVAAKDEQGESALMQAVRKGHVEVVRLLLERGADCSTQDKGGESVLKTAIRWGHLEVARLLRSRGATSNENPLVLVAYLGEAEEVARLLGQGADANETDRFYGRTALMWAAEQGHPEVAKLLLDKGADVNAKTGEGWTALMSAAVGRDLEVVRLLLDKGADVNAEGSFHRRTALMWAVEGLFRNISARLPDKELDDWFHGRKPVIWTREGDYHGVVGLLRERGAILTLGAAAVLEDLEGVRGLLDKGGDVNAKEGDGSTPLMYAAESGNLEIVRLLLDKAADPNAKAENDWTALMSATLYGHLKVAQLLLERGVDINAQTMDGRTVRTIAERRYKAIDELLKSCRAESRKPEAEAKIPPTPFSFSFGCGNGRDSKEVCLADAFEAGLGVVLLNEGGVRQAKTASVFEYDHPGGGFTATRLMDVEEDRKPGTHIAIVGKDTDGILRTSAADTPILVPADLECRARRLLRSSAPELGPWPLGRVAPRVIRSPHADLIVFAFDEGSDGPAVLHTGNTLFRVEGWCTSRHELISVDGTQYLAYWNSCCGCGWSELRVYELSGDTPKIVYINGNLSM